MSDGGSDARVSENGGTSEGAEIDPITLEVLRNQLESIAEEMGRVLIRGAYSPNIKERQDCSTALFDVDGRLVAQAEHIPVHLGAIPRAVDAVLDRDPQPGDVFVCNDPFTGGTHLPDVTVVSPLAPRGEIVGYAASRAHHADVGGMTPGSMPAGAREIYQEGLRIPPVRLVHEGERDEELFSVLLANVRNPVERRADLRAQLAATERAERRLGEVLDAHGEALVRAGFDAVIEYSQARVESTIAALPDGAYEASDVMEGDGVTEDDIEIAATVTIDGSELAVDFAGTAPQVAGNCNAPLAVAESAVYFAVRCVTDPEIPANAGCYEPISVSAPEGCLLNPQPPAAVVGGNVETSQRVVDVMLLALSTVAPDRVPAQSQGTMNNLTIGARDGTFTYYETIGGGAGALPDADGSDGVQVGMTNTQNTPVESIEAEYPLRVERYALRPGTGGLGAYRGGLGLERTVVLETAATVSLLTERRRHRPQGVGGGGDGAPGANLLDGEPVPAKTTVEVEPGTTVTVLTPGGGGHGEPAGRDPDARSRDRRAGTVTESDQSSE